MLINQTFEIDSCDDVELNIKRTSKLEYRISYDDEKDIKAIVFIVGGFGANANISFLDFDREYIAKNFDVVAVHVFYHCFCARQSIDQKYNPKLIPNQDDLERVNGILKNINLGHLSVNKDNFEQIIPLIEQKVNEMKQAGLVDESQKIELSCDFIPPNGDYQNYGIMAAIDHINALKDLVKRFPEFADLPKIYGGGSYGGYLSLLIAKIAPWYVDGVIDNSGSALPSPMFILERESGQYDYFEEYPHNKIGFFIKTHWNADVNSKYFFHTENYLIRIIPNLAHLTIQASVNQNIILVSYHSLKDPFNTAKDKQTLFLAYKELGYDATLHLIKDESEIDGRFIKDLNHGMRITDKALFRKELPLMLKKLQKRKCLMQENSISYPCGNKVFIFKDVGDKFELEIKD
ncbi:carbonic anhydrase [Campylobacter jejuni]|nr:carbonic anhydrase [Campylobacter jejuni]